MTVRHFSASQFTPFLCVVCSMVGISFLVPLLEVTPVTTRTERGQVLLEICGALTCCAILYIVQKNLQRRSYTYTELQLLPAPAQARYLMKVCAHQFSQVCVQLVTPHYIDIEARVQDRKTLFRFIIDDSAQLDVIPQSLVKSARELGATNVWIAILHDTPVSLRASLRKHAITLLTKKTLISWLHDYSQATLV